MPALLYIYILYYASLKLSLKQKNRIYFFIPLLFLLRIIVPAFSGYNWHWRGNFLITGVPYFLVGKFFAEYKTIFSKLTVKILYTALYIGFIFAVFQVFISCKINIFDLGIFLSSTAVFLLAQKTPDNFICFFEKLGQKYSLYIYVTHILIADLVDKASFFFGIQDLKFYLWSRPICVIFITIISGLIFDYIRNIIISMLQKI